MKIALYISAALLFFTSCEKVISVDLSEGKKQLVVDGFLTDEPGPQTIHLSVTQPYFDNTTPPPAIGAVLKVISSQGDTFSFADNTNIGAYTWPGNPTDTLCKTGLSYTLNISYMGSTYTSSSKVNPVPPIDSLTFTPNTDVSGKQNGYVAQFFATDFKKQDDYYWVKYYRNDTLFSDPSSLLVSINGAIFAPGADGFQFIVPVRAGINDRSNPYLLGQTVKVEVLSISADTWQFFGQAKTQMTNAGLFATPPANVITNITKTSGDGISPIGWFCTSALSRTSAIAQ